MINEAYLQQKAAVNEMAEQDEMKKLFQNDIIEVELKPVLTNDLRVAYEQAIREGDERVLPNMLMFDMTEIRTEFNKFIRETGRTPEKIKLVMPKGIIMGLDIV